MPEPMRSAEPKRMMNRQDFLAVFNLNRDLAALREEYQKLIEQMCDENADKNWWPDKVNVKMGFVMVESPGPASSLTLRHRIQPAWREKLRKKADELRSARDKLECKVALVAVACGVPTKYIDISTGEITISMTDIVECPKSADIGDE